MHADCYISGFSAPSGAAVFMDSEINLASDEIATLQLESCMIRGNAATTNPEFGAAIFTRGVPLLLNATTLTGNGPREIAARGSEVYTVGGVEATKLVYDPSDESLVRSLQFLPEDSDYGSCPMHSHLKGKACGVRGAGAWEREIAWCTPMLGWGVWGGSKGGGFLWCSAGGGGVEGRGGVIRPGPIRWGRRGEGHSSQIFSMY